MWRALALAVAVAAGCGAGGHAPTARIALAPAYVPLGDGYQTDVVLDGTASRDDIDDPAMTMPLAFAWDVDDPAPRVVAGALDQAKVTVRLAGARPTTVTLAVTDASGETGRATVHVGVAIPPDGGFADLAASADLAPPPDAANAPPDLAASDGRRD